MADGVVPRDPVSAAAPFASSFEVSKTRLHRFGRNRKQSEWEFDASQHFGQLLGLALQLLDGPGSVILAGFPCTAGHSDKDGFEEMVAEAQTIAGVAIRRKPTIWPGQDFPFCPHRPTARFFVAELGEASGCKKD